ncbi:hypothetical protein T01_8212 [Trichinella spiralis]|uniref:Uncharacterized protein n=1 Tax=Trichinella spiralis TaxID=6334 RepID=A0A0V1ANL9_TRISP|nr:hypothetical protein T01_8212 [Trichinella spiralis]
MIITSKQKKVQHVRTVDGIFLLTSSTIIVGTTCVAADPVVVVVVVDADVEDDEVGLQILLPPLLPLSLPSPSVTVVSREDLSNWILGFLAAYRSQWEELCCCCC